MALSRVISEIFNVEKRDFEIRVMSKVVSFDRLGMVSYWCSIVTLFLRYLTSKNVVTLKSGSKVIQGHQNWHGLIRHLWLPI